MKQIVLIVAGILTLLAIHYFGNADEAKDIQGMLRFGFMAVIFLAVFGFSALHKDE